jgi:CBS domain-containing membrane protein
MLATTHSLLDLTAADLMSRDVVTIPEKMPLRAAANLLAEARITGAPVVDRYGRCVGVLSATDFLHRATRDEEAVNPACGHPSCYWADWQTDLADKLPAEDVAEFMTRDPVTATPATAIGTMARMMLDARIHRLIVVDADSRPVGIVSSTDILAAVARAEVQAAEA